MKLENRLKLARVNAGELTQQDLADLVGCSRQTINSIEKGKFNPSIELALKLAKKLQVSVDELFFLNSEKEEKSEP